MSQVTPCLVHLLPECPELPSRVKNKFTFEVQMLIPPIKSLFCEERDTKTMSIWVLPWYPAWPVVEGKSQYIEKNEWLHKHREPGHVNWERIFSKSWPNSFRVLSAASFNFFYRAPFSLKLGAFLPKDICLRWQAKTFSLVRSHQNSSLEVYKEMNT